MPNRLDYKVALKSSLYDFTSARDFYREATTAASIPMHSSLIRKYITLQALLITPIAPHWADYIWSEVLKTTAPSTIQNALWPDVPTPNPSLTAAREYVRSTSSAITSAEAAQQKRKEKGKAFSFDPKLPKQLTIFYAARFPAWQDAYLEIVRDSFDGMSFDEKNLNPKVQAKGKAELKRAMPLVQHLKKRLVGGESREVVFDRKLAFEEGEVLEKMVRGLRRTTGCKVIEVVKVEGEEGDKVGTSMGGEGEGGKRVELPPAAGQATPGSPSFHFSNIEG